MSDFEKRSITRLLGFVVIFTFKRKMPIYSKNVKKLEVEKFFC